jgi:hypothetical protein
LLNIVKLIDDVPCTKNQKYADPKNPDNSTGLASVMLMFACVQVDGSNCLTALFYNYST